MFLTNNCSHKIFSEVRPENAPASTYVMALDWKSLDFGLGLYLNIVMKQSDYAKRIMTSSGLNDVMSSFVELTAIEKYVLCKHMTLAPICTILFFGRNVSIRLTR